MSRSSSLLPTWTLLGLIGAASGSRADTPPDVRPAITKGLRRLEQGAVNYVTKRTCFSCHHQAMTIFAVTAARRHGFPAAADLLPRQVEFTLATFRDRRARVAKGEGIPGGNTMAAYALAALEAAGHPADATTTDLVRYLLLRQRPDGSWPPVMKRPPSEGSSFTNAALALRALRTYGTPGPKDEKDWAERVEKAFTRGKDWLLQADPETTEDRVFRLRGLIHVGAAAADVMAARALLMEEQRADGSWSQLPTLAGDAYATGSTLAALRLADLAADAPAYQKGVRYLLKTQQADGSWLVPTRSRPVQVFFDNGDPGGPAQFISFAATGWAVLALVEALPAKSVDTPPLPGGSSPTGER